MQLCDFASSREKRYYHLTEIGHGAFGRVNHALDLFLGLAYPALLAFTGARGVSQPGVLHELLQACESR
jgi:hypothetical protein